MKWTDSEDIGIALFERFPALDPLTVRFTDLREKVMQLYGFDDEADSNTLEVFISRLRRKLGRDHIQTLRGLGYRLAHSTDAAE